MRTKDQIIDQLNKMPKPYGSINQTSALTTHIMIEVLIDIRDHLTALNTILGSVEKVLYRSG
ncbi:hypothetical protein ES703_80245 [subsurface metagenome]